MPALMRYFLGNKKHRCNVGRKIIEKLIIKIDPKSIFFYFTKIISKKMNEIYTKFINSTDFYRQIALAIAQRNRFMTISAPFQIMPNAELLDSPHSAFPANEKDNVDIQIAIIALGTIVPWQPAH